MILGVKNGSFSYGKREILRNISFDLEEQKIMTILGPNGVGKTTLLKCIMGFLPWNGGEARILEKNLKAYSDRELWRQISYVPQAKRSAFSYGVLEMVVMGLDKELAGTLTSCTLVALSALLTTLGLYQKLAAKAGAGTLVPITGFANAVVSAAIEFKTEGRVLGTGAKMFIIAGPVIVYGTLAAVLYGSVYWLLQ